MRTNLSAVHRGRQSSEQEEISPRQHIHRKLALLSNKPRDASSVPLLWAEVHQEAKLFLLTVHFSGFACPRDTRKSLEVHFHTSHTL